MSEFSKYNLYYKEEFDGEQWVPVTPLEYYGEKIENESVDCGYQIYRWVWVEDCCEEDLPSGATIDGNVCDVIMRYSDGTSSGFPMVGEAIQADFRPYKDNLVAIEFSKCVDSIGYSAVNSFPSLTAVTLSDSISAIGDYGFNYNENLRWVSDGKIIETIGECAFRNCTKLSRVTLGDKLKTIGNAAFDECYALTAFTIPNTCTSIGYAAFDHCHSLKTINIPNSLTFLGYNAFSSCNSLSSVTIGSGLTSIEEYTFAGDNHLETVNMTTSISSIGSGAFMGVGNDTPSGICTINYNGTMAQWNAITKAQYSYPDTEDWDYDSKIKVICTDGTINYNNT